MSVSGAELRVNPGGALSPDEVVGRDDLVADIWRHLERRSVLLTSERRMGKTSVMRKMQAEPSPGVNPTKTSLQGIRTPEEFARRVIADIEASAPGVLTKPSFVQGLRKSGLKKVAAKPVEVEFEPTRDEAWKDVLTEAFAAVEGGLDERVLFLWDEVPHMVTAIGARMGAGAARDVLDVLDYARETYPSIRMVLSGSLGMHHVVADLRERGGNWMPMRDMAVVDVPPLSAEDSTFLAAELLANESIACADPGVVAETVASEVDGVPFYVHHTVGELLARQRVDGVVVDESRASAAVERAIADPLDPWQLRHYVDRVPTYYGDDSRLAYAVLDVVALDAAARSLTEIEGLVAAQSPPPEVGHLQRLVELLCKDHYIVPEYRFRLELVRRAWLARRRPR